MDGLNAGNARSKLSMEVWAAPSPDKTVDDLVAEFTAQGVHVKQVDRERRRVLVVHYENQLEG